MHRKKWVCRQGADVTFLMIDISSGQLPPSNSAPYIHQDTMDALRHPCDGKLYDSRTQYDAVTRAHGCMEGGDQLVNKDGSINYKYVSKPSQKESVKESILKTMQGYRREVHG